MDTYERFFMLLFYLMQRVMSGRRDIQWLNLELQRIVNTSNGPAVQIAGWSWERLFEMTDYWDQHAPRRGATITTLLAPLYATSFSYRNLKPLDQGIAAFARNLFTSVRVRGIRPVTWSQVMDQGFLDELLEGSQLPHEILAKQFAPLLGEDPQLPHNYTSKRSSAIRLADAMPLVGTPDQLVKILADNLRVVEQIIIEVGVLGEETSGVNTYPMTQLWTLGSWPLCFDNEDYLVMIVGEK